MIRAKRVVFRTPWFEVEAKETDLDSEPFYSLKLPDYIAIVALTHEGDLLLVEQYRPALERVTLELPSGLVDAGESPEACAARELEEETGYAAQRLELLGALYADTGRLQNKLWCYAARGVSPIHGWSAEPGLKVVLLKPEALEQAVREGRFNHALHVAALAMSRTS